MTNPSPALRHYRKVKDDPEFKERRRARERTARAAESKSEKQKRAKYLNNWKRERTPEQRERDTASMVRAAAKRRAQVDALKDAPCLDCGVKYPPCVMDFDHRPGETKAGDVAYIATRAKWPVVLAEMAKCDLVCSNCHRLRTHSRKGR